jgi:outer membrane protein assembly factor BamB
MRKIFWFGLLTALALPALAESTRFWRQESFADFEKGVAHGVALRSDGEILLAPRFQEIADPNLEFLWTTAADSSGNLYVGGGSPAKVVKINPDGETSTIFESKELEVHAMVADGATGTLYVATSPDGSVYEIPQTGEARVLFGPETKYLWDLVRKQDGTLFLATGDKGEIYRISPDGEGEVFFSSEETHVRALALDSNGTVHAGTAPNGLVLRISSEGEGFVLYETARSEVTALRFDDRGSLFVAAIGQKVTAPGYPTQPPVQTLPPQQQQTGRATAQVTVTATATPRVVSTPRLPFPTIGGSDIYRIASDGYPEILWSSPTALVYSLSFDKEGRLLAGTGNEGKLLAVDSPVLSTHLAQASSQQVTTLLGTGSGRVYVGTANPGKLFALGPELEREGSFESDVFDAKIFSRWGRISWQSRSPAPSGSVTLFTRTGNTSDPQKNWSAWSEAYTEADGVIITSPPARFIQWKTALQAVDSRTPGLSSVSLAYLRRNIAPVVEKIIIQEQGIAVRGFPQAQQQVQPAQLNLPPLSNRQTRSNPAAAYQQQAQQAPQRIEPPPQGFTEPGSRSVVWSADDENDDELVYTVYYRGQGESRWKLMEGELASRFHTWDAATLPDGAYYIRVVASDAPSNPPAMAQEGENVSDRFEVDNTPPRIDNLATSVRSRAVEVTFSSHDTYSTLQQADYSLDAGDWKMIFPESGTTDARQHNYRFRLDNMEAGEHTVVVRVYDRFDNPVLDKATFTIE